MTQNTQCSSSNNGLSLKSNKLGMSGKIYLRPKSKATVQRSRQYLNLGPSNLSLNHGGKNAYSSLSRAEFAKQAQPMKRIMTTNDAQGRTAQTNLNSL